MSAKDKIREAASILAEVGHDMSADPEDRLAAMSAVACLLDREPPKKLEYVTHTPIGAVSIRLPGGSF